MKKRNAFTLIELLAIIVILAIIAVITVPIILNIIENSRKGAAIDSAYGFRDSVNKLYVSKLSEERNYNLKLDGTYTVTNGIISGNGINEKVPVSGTIPTSGTLNYLNNILTSGCLVIGEYEVKYQNNEFASTEKGDCLTKYTVTFNSNEGSNVNSIEVEAGKKIVEPTNPTKQDLIFDGWYTDENLQTKFDFNQVINSDMTLYAKWSTEAFAGDTWDTFIQNVKNGNTSNYNVGDTTKIKMTINGTTNEYTLRIANKTNSVANGCKIIDGDKEKQKEGFSQTACGFVLEFADIITTHRMNPYNNTSINGNGNKGGWEYSEMRTYINNDIYNALPEPLKSAIIEVNTVSGYGTNDSENFTTQDKLYLLALKEVGFTNNYDTAREQTRTLDYYLENNQLADKKKSNTTWWLRSSHNSNDSYFFAISNSGSSIQPYANRSYGVAPAFRID